MALKSLTLAGLLSRRKAHLDNEDKADFPERTVEDPAFWPKAGPSLASALRRKGAGRPRILAEVKKASPSAGELSGRSATELCLAYARAGAHGLSVLADRPNFGGSPEDLRQCRAACPELPILYKDFVTEPYQVFLARSLGASAVLLMTQVLPEAELRRLFDLAASIGLEPFVEAHSPEEFDLALGLAPPLIGINARDFKTAGMPIDLLTGPRILRARFGERKALLSTVFVCQSGIEDEEDIRRIESESPAGMPDAVQIGAGLSRSGGAWLRDYLAQEESGA